MITTERLMDFVNANDVISICINDALDYHLGEDRDDRDFSDDEYDTLDGIIYAAYDLFDDKYFTDKLCKILETDDYPVETMHDLILSELGVLS